MTGGQPVEGELSIPRMAAELLAEGVRRVVVVSDEPEKYASIQLPSGVPVHHRRELDRIQRELREEPGVTVFVYDQLCATERRRQRKRGKLADVPRRIFIHPEVCEGCGDCSVKSNCMSVEPLETELGRKRRINQSTCNKDETCVEGFCPSFVTLVGARPVRGVAQVATGAAAEPDPSLPEPVLPALGGRPYEADIYSRMGDVYFEETKYAQAVQAYKAVLSGSGDGDLYVSDRGANRVYRLSPNNVLTPIAGNGTQSGGGEGFPAVQTGLIYPRAVWFLHNGGFFTCEHSPGNRIWYIDPAGIIHRWMNGSDANNFRAGDGAWFYANPGQAKVSRVRAVIPDSAGNLIITESNYGYVRRIRFQRMNP